MNDNRRLQRADRIVVKRGALPRDARRGVMLLIVTLVLTALTLSGAALLTLMKTEQEATFTRGREELVRGVARSAVVYLSACVETNQTERDKKGGLYNNPQLFCAAQLLDRSEGGADSSRFTILSPKLEDSTITGARYGLVDESSRLNLQAVLEWEKEEAGAGRNALMKLPGMTPTAADSILDWIDPDENPRQNGAEASYYSQRNLPYSPRNATPVFLEELLLARGVTRTQLYGADENYTYNTEKSSGNKSQSTLGGSLRGVASSIGNENSEGITAPWNTLLTVFSAEKDVDPKGEARVNLNVDDLQFLYQELESRVGADLAKFIVLYRQYGPKAPEEDAAPTRRGYGRSASRLATPAATANVAPLAQAPLDYSVAATTQLATPLDVVGAVVQINDVDFASPLLDSAANANINRIMTLLDYASTSPTTTIVGRVNVNAAPRPVLAALPGLANADVQRILDARPDPAEPTPSEYRHAIWLYAKGVVTLDVMKKLYNKTTGRGDVFRGQIVGFLDDSDETTRAEVVVDGTTVPPRQVFYKDLTSLGKGFSDAVLLGGNTTSTTDPNASFGVSELDWQAVQDFPDATSQSSGYNLGAFSNEDPFAAVEIATGVSPTSDFDATAQPPLGDSFIAADGARDATGTDPLATAVDATNSPATTGAQDASSSRRDRLLQALQSSRADRQSRNESLGSSSTTDSPAASETSTGGAPPSSVQESADATAEAPTATTAGTQESSTSRRDRLLQALQSSRSDRQSRNQSLNSSSGEGAASNANK